MIPPNPSLPRKVLARARQSAFSLVEVVLAVGVISFAFVAILGLMPAGLAQFRQAMDNSVGSQISQRIILECQQTDFDTLVNPTNAATPPLYTQFAINGRSVRYFDEQGNEIIPSGTTPSGPEAALVVYYVNTRIASSTQMTESSTAGADTTVYPAGTSYGVATVVVQVAFNPGNLDLSSALVNNLWNPTIDPRFRGVTIKTYCAQVGRND